MAPIAEPAAAATRTWTYPLRHNGLEAWSAWEECPAIVMERPPDGGKNYLRGYSIYKPKCRFGQSLSAIDGIYALPPRARGEVRQFTRLVDARKPRFEHLFQIETRAFGDRRPRR
jgi:hypothetical protein